MLNITPNAAVTLPVVMKDASGDPVTGLVFGDITCKYSQAGGAIGTLVITALNWTEIGQGLYTIDFTATETDTVGWFTYLVTGTGAKQYDNTVNVTLGNYACRFTATYNESTTDLVIRAWLELDGAVVAAPTSCAISIKDDTEVEQWALTDASPSADGFFTITETGPTLEDDHNYSAEVSIVYGGNTYTSGSCMLTVA
jgi:hypothetical protein